jgi:hypothetical protein
LGGWGTRRSAARNDLLEVDVNMELLAKSLGVMQPWETLAASPPPGRRSRQAPHRHRQAKSGTYRGREPPHARHTCLGQPTAEQGRERGNLLDAPAYPLYQEHGQGAQVLGTAPELRNNAKASMLRPDHLRPLLVIGDEFSEISGRCRDHRTVEAGEPRLDLGIGDACVDFPVKFFRATLVFFARRCAPRRSPRSSGG